MYNIIQSDIKPKEVNVHIILTQLNNLNSTFHNNTFEDFDTSIIDNASYAVRKVFDIHCSWHFCDVWCYASVMQKVHVRLHVTNPVSSNVSQIRELKYNKNSYTVWWHKKYLGTRSYSGMIQSRTCWWLSFRISNISFKCSIWQLRTYKQSGNFSLSQYGLGHLY